jgi:hypothetical protein
MTIQIKLMPDYQCYPLWLTGNDGPANIDPVTLPLIPETILRLERWADIFDSWMDLDNPTSTSEPRNDEVSAFEDEGIELWKQLRRELEPAYEVFYKSIMQNKLLFNPNELDEVELETA